jgi:hypothetical protein
MEDNYGYQPNHTENRNRILGKVIFVFLLVILIGIAVNFITMFFDFNKSNEDIKIIRASKYPLKIFIEKPKIIDQVGIYEALENNATMREQIIPVEVEEPRKINLKKAEELAKRVINFEEIEEQNLNVIIVSDDGVDNNGFKAQISAMSKRKNATKYWHKIKNNHPNIFKNLKYFIQKIDFPNRKSLFRLQIIDFKNELEVEDFCLKFIHTTKQSHSNCIIISPQ